MTESIESKKFFLVWSPQGPTPPVFRYPSFGAARASAVRLSLRYPEQDFFVLETCWGKLGELPPEAVPEPSAPDVPVPDVEGAS
jgi:hypothetical protein